MRNIFRKIVFIGFAALFFLLVLVCSGEVLFRVFLGRYVDNFYFLDVNPTYRFDPGLGWFPRENSDMRIPCHRLIQVKHNKQGFRDSDHGKKEKPRILFLGDSFVWGYDVEQKDRFTDMLQKTMPEWEVLNLGVNGYGTDQELLLIQKFYKVYQPDIVVLVFDYTDYGDVMNNSVYGGYFKPYFIEKDGDLQLRGVPVPKSANYYYSKIPFYQRIHPILNRSYFCRAAAKAFKAVLRHNEISTPNCSVGLIKKMRSFVEDQGAVFVVGLGYHDSVFAGLREKNEELYSILNKNNIKCLKLETDFIFYSNGYHWTPKGHSVVSEKIRSFLKEKGLI